MVASNKKKTNEKAEETEQMRTPTDCTSTLYRVGGPSVPQGFTQVVDGTSSVHVTMSGPCEAYETNKERNPETSRPVGQTHQETENEINSNMLEFRDSESEPAK